MTGYGQFWSMARAHEALGGRWTLLIVREILCGSKEALAHAASISSGGAPMVMVVTDDA